MTTRTITLTPREIMHLTAANRFLAKLTERHHPDCECDLCHTRIAVLADALEEAGCTDPAILSHLRGPGPHVRGCWHRLPPLRPNAPVHLPRGR